MDLVYSLRSFGLTKRPLVWLKSLILIWDSSEMVIKIDFDYSLRSLWLTEKPLLIIGQFGLMNDIDLSHGQLGTDLDAIGFWLMGRVLMLSTFLMIGLISPLGHYRETNGLVEEIDLEREWKLPSWLRGNLGNLIAMVNIFINKGKKKKIIFWIYAPTSVKLAPMVMLASPRDMFLRMDE